jgi:predicted nucleic acid-binding protein
MRAIGDLTASEIRLHPIAIVAPQALSLALAHGFTAYDASYVAVATRVGGIVVTNDGGMRQRAVEAGLPVIAPRELR